MTERNETMWCTLCGARFTDAEIKGWGCPKCGNEGVPCGTPGDVKVEINWHELHVLCCWAEFWANQCQRQNPNGKGEAEPKVVYAIARRLRQQHPKLGALTLSSEIFELPGVLAKSGVEIGPIETRGIAKQKPLPVNGPGAVGHSR